MLNACGYFLFFFRETPPEENYPEVNNQLLGLMVFKRDMNGPNMLDLKELEIV